MNLIKLILYGSTAFLVVGILLLWILDRRLHPHLPADPLDEEEQ